MLGDFIVADATAHGYNWAPSNWAIPESASTTAAGWGLHQLLTVDPDLLLTESEYVRDWPAQDISDTLFYEGGVDLICHHGTPIFDFYKDGHSATEKGFTMRDQHPDRTLVYGAINPFDGERWRDDIEYLVSEKKVDGLKIYAARYDQGRTIEQRLDDPELGYPFIERALELGVKVIATHKGIPFGPVRSKAYGVEDVPEVLAVFPTMNFEVVHSGWAFVEDTTFLAFFPNCWFNLEMCFALINRQPRRFAEFMGALIGAGGGDRIMYSSGLSAVHPLPALQAFRDFEMPQDLQEGYACPPMSDDLKRGVLGENLLRLHGIDPAAFRTRVADDDVSRKQAAGLDEPWSHVRARAGAAA
jgi:predicted TIM-barrel fold metal-dependent hydrolase